MSRTAKALQVPQRRFASTLPCALLAWPLMALLAGTVLAQDVAPERFPHHALQDGDPAPELRTDAARAVLTDPRTRSSGIGSERERQRLLLSRSAASLPATAITADAGVMGATTPATPAGGHVAEAAASTLGVVRLPEALHEQIKAVAAREFALAPASSVTVFPYLLRSADETGASVDSALVVETGGPLSYRAEDRMFVGELKVGAMALSGPGRQALPDAIRFQILEAGVATPEQASVDRTGVPLQSVAIATASPGNPFTIRVATDRQPGGIPVRFALKPTLFIESDRRSIQGYGLETTRLAVSTIGVADPESLQVSLATDPSAHLDDARLTLDRFGGAEALLRSDGVGPVKVSASLPGLSTASTAIEFAFPWATIIAALLGGLLGGMVRLLGSRRDRRKPWARSATAMLVSVLVGVLVLGMMILGVDVLGQGFDVRVGQLFAFIVSALGAYAGTALLDARLFPTGQVAARS